METTIVHLDELEGRERYIAQYLAALSQYRQAMNLAKRIDQTGEGAAEYVDKLHDQAADAKAQMEDIAAQAVPVLMEPAAAAAEHLGYSMPAMRHIIQHHGDEGDGRVRAEKRHGMWWVFAPDIEGLIDEGVLRGPRGEYRKGGAGDD